MTVRRALVLNPTALREQQLQLSDSLENIRACDASATAISTTSLADIAGLTFALEAGQTYRFECEGVITQTGLLANVGFGTAYTGTASSLVAYTNLNGTAGTLLGLNLASVLAVALGGTVGFSVVGRIRTTTAGNLTFQGQRSAGTTTINGASAQLTRV